MTDKSIYRNQTPAFDDDWLHDDTPIADDAPEAAPLDASQETTGQPGGHFGRYLLFSFVISVIVGTGQMIMFREWFARGHHLTTPLGTFYALAAIGVTIVAIVFMFAGAWSRRV